MTRKRIPINDDRSWNCKPRWGVMECEGYGVKEVPYGPSVLAALVADVQKNNTIWQYILGCECPSLKEVLNGGS